MFFAARLYSVGGNGYFARCIKAVTGNGASSIDVENRDYHYLSHTEIRGAKRISQHLSAGKLISLP